MANKVRFGLNKVHYAVLTEGKDSSGNPTYTYGTPVRIPGAVSLDIDAESEATEFWGDDIKYYAQYNNNGYSGSLEVAMIPESMWTDVFGMTKDSNGVFVEKSTDTQKDIALLYQISGDANSEGYLLYKCSLGKPSQGGETMEGSRDPQTYTVDITAVARDDGKVFAHTGSESTAKLATWFDSVYEGT